MATFRAGIAIGVRMFLGMQDFDFAQIQLNLAKSNQFCPLKKLLQHCEQRCPWIRVLLALTKKEVHFANNTFFAGRLFFVLLRFLIHQCYNVDSITITKKKLFETPLYPCQRLQQNKTSFAPNFMLLLSQVFG